MLSQGEGVGMNSWPREGGGGEPGEGRGEGGMQRMPPSATMGFCGTFHIIRHKRKYLREHYCY